MEKRIPHSKLTLVKKLISEGKVRLSASASQGGRELGLDNAGVILIVSELTSIDFYKSMRTYADDRIWQDVYKPSTIVGEVYLKLTVIDDVLIVSFKEK